MPLRILQPYCNDQERLEHFMDDVTSAGALERSISEFRHVILALPTELTLGGLKTCLDTAVKAYIESPASSAEGYFGVVETAGLPHSTHLTVSCTHYRPTAVPPHKSGPPSCSPGFFPVIRTNNIADYVGLGSRPAPAMGFDGSFRDNMHCRDLIIAPSGTARALRLFEGVIPHILYAL